MRFTLTRVATKANSGSRLLETEAQITLGFERFCDQPRKMYARS